nr:MAG TPA: hypothetical protein [Caudoviricetes sp.]
MNYPEIPLNYFKYKKRNRCHIVLLHVTCGHA